jgi:putative peptidoglycan lipid II flippase
MTNSKKRSFLTVAFMIFAMIISKLLGMLRGVLLASAYGITEEATAFSAASRIPLSFFDIVFASAILGCFIPVYNSFSHEETEEKNKFTSVYLNFMLLLTGVISAFGIIFAPQILSIIAPDMLPETALVSAKLLRIMFPLIVFAAASYTLVGVLQSNGKFIAPAFISAVSNLLVIVYFLFFDKHFGIKGLAVSYTLGWIVQLLTLIFSLSKKEYCYKLLFDFKNKAFLKALKLTPLIIMGSWLAPFCMLISMRVALSTGISGAVPSFEYSINLFTVITGITTYGICNYIFPELSSLASGENEHAFVSTCKSGLSVSLLMTVPISACVLALAPYAVCIIYKRGSFDVYAAEQVSLILKFLVPGMIGFTLTEVLSRVFYARKTPVFPVISVVLGIIINAVLSYVLCETFSLGLSGLGLSYSASILGAGIIMIVFAAIKMKSFFDIKYIANLIKIFIAGFTGYIVMKLVNNLLSVNPYTATFISLFVCAAVCAICGVAVYFVILILLREDNVKNIFKNHSKGVSF